MMLTSMNTARIRAHAWLAARWAEASTHVGIAHITIGLALRAAQSSLQIASSTPGRIGLLMAAVGAVQVLIPQRG